MNNQNESKNAPVSPVAESPVSITDTVTTEKRVVSKPKRTTPASESVTLSAPKVISAKTIAAQAGKLKVTTEKKPVAKNTSAKLAVPNQTVKPVTVKADVATTKVVKRAATPVVKASSGAAIKPAAARKVIAKPVSVAAVAKEKTKKEKLVRDSFTMPETEYAALNLVKKACLSAGVEVKKSQLLRIGVRLLSQTDVKTLNALIADLAPLKAGRPKKEK